MEISNSEEGKKGKDMVKGRKKKENMNHKEKKRKKKPHKNK